MSINSIVRVGVFQTLLALFLISNWIPPVIAGEMRVAITPPSNRTGMTDRDYQSDLFFQLAVSALAQLPGVRLYERSRADLVLKERILAVEAAPEDRPQPRMDAVISGEWRGDSTGIHLRWDVARIAGDAFILYDSVEIVVRDDTAAILSEAVRDLFATIADSSGAGELGFRPGSRIVITGFNNYTGKPEFDHLQRGLSHLMEVRAGQSGSFDILERDELARAIEERKLALAGAADVSKFAFDAADVIITGCMSMEGENIRIDVRFIETATSRILAAIGVAGRNAALAAQAACEAVSSLLADTVGTAPGDGSLPWNEDGPSGQYPVDPEALMYYARGVENVDFGDYLAAVENINRALLIDPSYSHGRLEVATIYEEQLRNYAKAAEAYKKILIGNPSGAIHERALLRVGMIHYRRFQDYSGSAEFLGAFIQEFPRSAYDDVARYALGHSLQKIGKYRQAIEILESALQESFSPLTGKIHLRLGECYLFEGNTLAAETHLEIAIARHGSEISDASADRSPLTIGDEARQLLEGRHALPVK